MLVGIAASAASLRALLPDESFVRLHRFPGSAHGLHLHDPHRLTQPMRHEPCRFQRDAQRAMKLVAADPLLAAAQKERCLEPDMQRDMARLEYGADADGELLPAGIAFLQPGAGAAILVLDAGERRRLADRAAMRAGNPAGQTIASSRSNAACSSVK